MTLRVPCSGRSGRSSYIAVCAINSVHVVSDAEVDLFDAIFKRQLGDRELAMSASNDNCALEGGLCEHLAERPQV